MSGLRVDLGGIEFNSDVVDANGTRWLMTELEGWDAMPIRQTLLDPTGQHGSVMGSATYGPRGLVIKGLAKTVSEAMFWIAYNQISSLVVPFAPRDMIVYETVSKQVGVVDGGNVRKLISAGTVAFEIPLLALDPLKYNVIEHTSALPGTINNAGNIETYPVITLTDGGNYTITNTTQGAGASIVVTGAPAGSVLDMRRRTLTLAGVDYYAAVQPQSVWWALLPDNNIITKTGGAASIAWRDAWK